MLVKQKYTTLNFTLFIGCINHSQRGVLLFFPFFPHYIQDISGIEQWLCIGIRWFTIPGRHVQTLLPSSNQDQTWTPKSRYSKPSAMRPENEVPLKLTGWSSMMIILFPMKKAKISSTPHLESNPSADDMEVSRNMASPNHYYLFHVFSIITNNLDDFPVPVWETPIHLPPLRWPEVATTTSVRCVTNIISRAGLLRCRGGRSWFFFSLACSGEKWDTKEPLCGFNGI